MTEVPPAIPVTRPALLIVAIFVDADDQGLVELAVAVPANCVVDPTHVDKTPEMLGSGLTVIIADPVLSPATDAHFASVKDSTVYVFDVDNETENVYGDAFAVIGADVVDPSE